LFFTTKKVKLNVKMQKAAVEVGYFVSKCASTLAECWLPSGCGARCIGGGGGSCCQEAINKGLLFPNVGHKCLMAKDGKKKKVKSRSSTKYATSSDEANSSDDEDDLFTLFANLNMQQKEKLNELISAIHEKDELLDSQEDFCWGLVLKC
jgi:hypothetical protein